MLYNVSEIKKYVYKNLWLLANDEDGITIANGNNFIIVATFLYKDIDNTKMLDINGDVWYEVYTSASRKYLYSTLYIHEAFEYVYDNIESIFYY